LKTWALILRADDESVDVTDLAFSPGDSYLASVGLDSKVLIWNGATLELVRMLDGHQGYVKGVCWDPVGQYLATQVCGWYCVPGLLGSVVTIAISQTISL